MHSEIEFPEPARKQVTYPRLMGIVDSPNSLLAFTEPGVGYWILNVDGEIATQRSCTCWGESDCIELPPGTKITITV